jgi:hypothetical protein
VDPVGIRNGGALVTAELDEQRAATAHSICEKKSTGSTFAASRDYTDVTSGNVDAHAASNGCEKDWWDVSQSAGQ